MTSREIAQKISDDMDTISQRLPKGYSSLSHLLNTYEELIDEHVREKIKEINESKNDRTSFRSHDYECGIY